MRRTLRGLVTAVAVLALVGLSVGVVAAGTQGSDCTTDTSKVRLWENAIGDTGDNNDSYWKCSSDSNLDSDGDQHTLPGDCKGFFLSSITWNDCVSSYTIWVPAGQCLLFYREANYGTDFAVWAGLRSNERKNVPSGSNDTLSSFRWVTC